MSYLNNQNVLQKNEQLVNSTSIQDCVFEVFLPDKHHRTNLAGEIGQLIPSHDFDTVCWLLILVDTERTWHYWHYETLFITAWLQLQRSNLIYINI